MQLRLHKIKSFVSEYSKAQKKRIQVEGSLYQSNFPSWKVYDDIWKSRRGSIGKSNEYKRIHSSFSNELTFVKGITKLIDVY
jgi:hypothetical protein